MTKLGISIGYLEVEKPSGGGHGPTTPYIVEVTIDGVVALHLQRFHFKQTGQMEAFAEALAELLKR